MKCPFKKITKATTVTRYSGTETETVESFGECDKTNCGAYDADNNKCGFSKQHGKW